MACSCISCKECNGTGNVWRSFSGEYLGSNRSDDLDKMEACSRCDEGVVEFCQECIDSFEDEKHQWPY
jgi:hypothetical protein